MARFFVGFLLLQALLFGAELTPWAQTYFVAPWTHTLTALSADIVRFFDPGVVADGEILQSADGSFAVSIEAGCNGVEATIVLNVWQALIMLDVLIVWLLWVRTLPRAAPARAIA